MKANALQHSVTQLSAWHFAAVSIDGCFEQKHSMFKYT